jgi:hypothetical protein
MDYFSSFERDDALEEGLALLEKLRSALPPDRESAVDEAKALLVRASQIYSAAQLAAKTYPKEKSNLYDVLPDEYKAVLEGYL